MVRIWFHIFFILFFASKTQAASWRDLDGKKVRLVEGKTKNCVYDGLVSIEVKGDGFEFRLGALHRFLVADSGAKGKSDASSSEEGCKLNRTTEGSLKQNEVKIITFYRDCKDKKKNRDIIDTWSFDSGFLNHEHSRTDAGKSTLPGSFSCRFAIGGAAPAGGLGPASGK